jgi:O-acetyl-ADP-ribose deacetylase (regulator of RNase III)
MVEDDRLSELLPLLGVPLPSPEAVLAEPTDARRRLRVWLTVSPTREIPAAAWPLLDALFADEAARRPVTRAADLPRLAATGWGARVSVWRGDITTLAVDALVNAANNRMTGCWSPFHACVDNAIHSAAGPRLRQACEALMAERGRFEPTATATVTPAGALSARYVVHTVGPIVRTPPPTPDDAALLARCYSACFDAVAGRDDVASLAFCGISTGVFGYPPAAAAPVALAAVRDALARSASPEHVVFVTYTAAEHEVFVAAVQEALRG